MPARQHVLICFDDSASSRQAIAEAARLFPGADAVVLHVWRPLEATVAYRYSAAGITGALEEQMRELDAAGQQTALEIAEQGAELARQAGLSAEARAIELSEDSASAVAAVAAEIDASAIVVGSRRLGAFQAMALGGFSHAVLQRSERPVLVVPALDAQ
jgi:nucleotide-binding universal stress UspA family protein